MTVSKHAAKRFSDQLEQWLNGKRPHTIAGLSEVFREKSFAVVFLVLMFIPALPLPTGGITHIFEIITMLLALELMVGQRRIWLPKRWKQAKILGSQKVISLMIGRIRWLERFTRPRLGGLLEYRPFIMLTGAVVFIFALAAFLAPPFSGLDTLPALGVVVISLALILEDAVAFTVGLLIGIAGIGLEISLGEAAVHFLPGLF